MSSVRRDTLRLATRRSPLALWQANHVVDLLRTGAPDVRVDLVDLDTHADQRLDLPISELGGKGAFSKEVQQLVLEGRADLAVHSAKDLQAVTPTGLVLAAFPGRGDPRDALVGGRLDDLREGALVATGSNRRRVQLSHLRPDLRFEGLRGNIATRLSKADGFDAIVMASAALDRLGLEPGAVDVLDPTVLVPQVGQGALAVECRSDDEWLINLLAGIDHHPTRRVVEAERAFLRELGGDCELPAGAFAVLEAGDDGQIVIEGVLAASDESSLARRRLTGASGPSLGTELARSLRREVDVGPSGDE